MTCLFSPRITAFTSSLYEKRAAMVSFEITLKIKEGEEIEEFRIIKK